MTDTPTISEGEKEVIRLILNGFSSRKFAVHMDISFHSSKARRKHVMEKSRVIHAAQLMVLVTKIYWLY